MKKFLLLFSLVVGLFLIPTPQVYAGFGAGFDSIRADTLRVDTTIISKAKMAAKTTITVLAAPGSDKYYAIEKIPAYSDTGRAYTSGRGGVIIGYGTGFLAPQYIPAQIYTTTPPFLTVLNTNGALGGDYTLNQYQVVNKAICVRAGTGSTSYTGGTCQVRLIIYYRILTVK